MQGSKSIFSLAKPFDKIVQIKTAAIGQLCYLIFAAFTLLPLSVFIATFIFLLPKHQATGKEMAAFTFRIFYLRLTPPKHIYLTSMK